MLFTSFIFLAFIVLFLPIYFYTKGRCRLKVCLFASYLFYGWWDYRFLSLIILSTTVDYVVAKYIETNKEIIVRRRLLAISVITNLSILGIFKYLDFFIESFVNISNVFNVDLNPPVLNIILPVGISFYTFQTMSYTIDVYNKKCQVEHNYLRFAAYVALFPQLVAGPIVRAKLLLPQIKIDRKFDWQNFCKGMELIIWGYFLKLCVADRLGYLVEPTYSNPDSFGGAVHIISTIAFSFQIYGDFCGYSLIAIGLGRIMGFDFGINFNKPYYSRSFSEFWNRWHISLSSWLRDYLYIPLGGNRLGSIITFRNLLVVMFLGGLWHGAAWTFVIWGLLHGFYLVVQHFLSLLNLEKNIKQSFFINLISILKVLSVFFFVNVAWIFFRSNSIEDAILIFNKIITSEHYFYGISFDLFSLVIGYSMIAIVVFIELFSMLPSIKKIYETNCIVRAGSMLVLLWLILLLGVFEGTTFIYFQF